MRAEALSREHNHISGLALGRSGDPAIGDFGDPKVIRKYCELIADPIRTRGSYPSRKSARGSDQTRSGGRLYRCRLALTAC
ncbi:hypothetical protein CWO89_39925 [Bradyrhizobium sp. Leo170]|nr:hypothetical protein CWO90_41930 [Bradyrhizobium sp. Leo121]TAI60572.1 hypothetical protein CWO89_39925 [Bradyrhizobium sp. Leo170]